MHAIIQSDERIRSIVEHIDRSLEELDSMESWLSLYGAELNVSIRKGSEEKTFIMSVKRRNNDRSRLIEYG